MTPHERTKAWNQAIREQDWATARFLSVNSNQLAQVLRHQAGHETDQTFGSQHTRYIMQALKLEKDSLMETLHARTVS